MCSCLVLVALKKVEGTPQSQQMYGKTAGLRRLHRAENSSHLHHVPP